MDPKQYLDQYLQEQLFLLHNHYPIGKRPIKLLNTDNNCQEVGIIGKDSVGDKYTVHTTQSDKKRTNTRN